MGSTQIHSNKTNKDFLKVNLIIEGEFVGFFMPANMGAKLMATKPFVENAKTKSPTKCVATLNLKFGQRGTFVDLENVA